MFTALRVRLRSLYFALRSEVTGVYRYQLRSTTVSGTPFSITTNDLPTYKLMLRAMLDMVPEDERAGLEAELERVNQL